MQGSLLIENDSHIFLILHSEGIHWHKGWIPIEFIGLSLEFIVLKEKNIDNKKNRGKKAELLSLCSTGFLSIQILDAL